MEDMDYIASKDTNMLLYVAKALLVIIKELEVLELMEDYNIVDPMN